MADREITPYGCRHCGDPLGHHGHQWHSAAGMHTWEAPTSRQILTRMRIRRAYRLEARRG
ncbi:hypothetical protein ACTVZO_05195 [Streptomyces sp. IBSNAI002]|uniref:hypothetical protein n=1 Tax=Streptomyces sp. IBSNAI002 TaxID=3457500 RepID=UPI003FD32BA8